jgi:hypothetical protein
MSFARNQKRVAGPGFHVNVRYDDHQVSKMKQMTNVASQLSKGARLAELYDVKEQELLVAMRGNRYAAYFDGYTHCFSAINGFPNTQQFSGQNDSAKLKEYILNEVDFVGVATTEYIPKPGYQEQGFVAQVGGVVTLLNESGLSIHPGQKVMLDVVVDYRRQTTREKGIPREKVRFTVAPALTSDEIIEKAIADVGMNDGDEDCKDAKAELAQVKAELKALKEEAKKEPDKPELKERLRVVWADAKRLTKICDGNGGVENVRAVIRKVNELNSRIIGKSYSYSRPGDRLEVGLQPRNPY